MRRRSGERGTGNVGCVLWVVLLLVGVLIAWKVIPIKIKSAEFYDHMVELSKFSATTTPDKLASDILLKAQELDLPLDKDHIKVERIGDRIKMEAIYTVPIHFPGYTYEWQFDHQVDRPIYIF